MTLSHHSNKAKRMGTRGIVGGNSAPRNLEIPDDSAAFRHRPDWYDDALCALPEHDPNIFFLEGKYRRNTQPYREARDRAKKICAECPVTTQCLEWALANDVRNGIWGGTTAYERRLKQYPKQEGQAS